jgi:hypothetical protein
VLGTNEPGADRRDVCHDTDIGALKTMGQTRSVAWLIAVSADRKQ